MTVRPIVTLFPTAGTDILDAAKQAIGYRGGFNIEPREKILLYFNDIYIPVEAWSQPSDIVDKYHRLSR